MQVRERNSQFIVVSLPKTAHASSKEGGSYRHEADTGKGHLQSLILLDMCTHMYLLCTNVQRERERERERKIERER